MIKVVKLKEEAIIPTRSYPTDAGLDIYSTEDVFIPVGKTVEVSTGISIIVPYNTVGKIEDRSSLGRQGLRTGSGVIDHGYTGEITIILHNLTCVADNIIDTTKSNRHVIFGKQIKKGDRIAQLLVYSVNTDAVTVVESNNHTYARGSNGFGSSGR